MKTSRTFRAEIGKLIRTFALIFSNEVKAASSPNGSPKYGRVAQRMRQNFGTKVLRIREQLHQLSPSQRDEYLAQILDPRLSAWFSDRSGNLNDLRSILTDHVKSSRTKKSQRSDVTSDRSLVDRLVSSIRRELQDKEAEFSLRSQEHAEIVRIAMEANAILHAKVDELTAELEKLRPAAAEYDEWKRMFEWAEIVIEEQSIKFKNMRETHQWEVSKLGQEIERLKQALTDSELLNQQYLSVIQSLEGK